MEPKLLEDKEICKDIKNYSLITARESISYEALKKVNNNTYLVSDPAFCLIPKEVELPELFVENNTLGINLSPMVIDNENIAGVTIKNYENLINYIIENTNLQIALIPHVVWENGDDRGPLKKLYLMYKNTDRVMLVDDYDSQELKYIISKCKFFIGARTHSTIAAYSSCIPTIVIGYSVKAKGIAKDIFGSFENYVIPVQSLSDEFTLVHGIEWLIKKEISIREHLKSIMPEYIEKARKANELLKKIGDENV